MAIQEKKIKFPYKSEVSFETANRRFTAKIYVHRIATLHSIEVFLSIRVLL